MNNSSAADLSRTLVKTKPWYRKEIVPEKYDGAIGFGMALSLFFILLVGSLSLVSDYKYWHQQTEQQAYKWDKYKKCMRFDPNKSVCYAAVFMRRQGY